MDILNNKRKVYKFAFQFLVLAIAFVFQFGETISKLVIDWTQNDNYSHGFLIPFITAYMVWQKKEKLSKIKKKESRIGLIFLFFGMILFIIGNIGAELFTMRFAMIVVIASLIYYLYGLKFVLAIGVPLAYLIFMVPLPFIIWNKIAFPLQLFAAKLTSSTVMMMGIPIFREGNVLHLSNTTLEVVDACSGLRSLTALFALSGAFAYLSNLTVFNKWILFFTAMPIAIFVNVIRLVSTALLATHINPDIAYGFLHDFSGMIVFMVAILMTYGIYILMLNLEKKYMAKAANK